LSVKEAPLAHHFESLAQQQRASLLGMWMFLATEILFFGGMFAAYTVYRWMYPEAFLLGSKQLNEALGGVNTAVLLTSSLTMVLAVYSAHAGSSRFAALWLGLTVVLGVVFLVIKGFEWTHDYHEGLIPVLPNWNRERWADAEPPVNPEHGKLFFLLYFIMTGMHALHMLIGFGVIAVILVQALRERYSPEYYTPVEVTGLYWHFVDVIWIFLFPLFYLIRH
jgi:cytochrome c oxidase subunit 3